MRGNKQERERIGQRIAEIRREQGITQLELAERTGIRREHVCRIEQGRYSVGFDALQSIAEVLGKRIDLVSNRKKTKTKHNNLKTTP